MSKKTPLVFVPLVILLVGSLACSRLGGGSTSSAQATVNAAYTQAAAGAATAGALGGSAGATANAASTEAMATANAATGGNTSAATATTKAGGEPTAAATTGGGGQPASGGPSDVPVIEAQNTILLANAQLVSYQTKADLATVVAFYKGAMPKNGWTADASLSVETPNATVLAFKKGTRQAQVSIAPDPNSKQTIVLITLS